MKIPSPSLRTSLTLTGLLFLVSLVAVLTSWPLPRYATTGIPYSVRNFAQRPARYNIAGDHLQLMYHFDLVHDMITGRISWFHNPFEFNVDGDDTTYRPGAYFLPLSGVYAVLRMIMVRPLAYNLTWLLSLWLTVLFSWAWLSGFSKDKAAIFMGVLILILIPFRWFSLFSGSPSGMALCWVPLLAWRVDRAIRDPGWFSGLWVGLALLLAFFGDLHVFYFGALALPAFAGLSLLSHLGQGRSLPWRRWHRILPSGLASLGILVAYYSWRRHLLAGSMMHSGRSWTEAATFSPLPIGLLGQGRTLDETIFIGLLIMLTLIVLCLLLMHQSLRRLAAPASRYRIAIVLLLLGATLVTIFLGLGAHGPFGGRFLAMARAGIPYYEMIRQPYKIYALMPIWLGCLATIGWSALPRSSWMRPILAILLVVGMVYEIQAHFNVTTSLLQPEQAAYERVYRDAAERGHLPARAIIVPLWPGESADTSLPILHAHHYGIRLINGYSPVIGRNYFEDVFRRLESINQGWLQADQIEFLLARDVRYVILHENQFPDKVSPHPVALTRDLLLAHPRLTFLQQAGPVWAFRIETQAAQEAKPLRAVARFPTRLWSFASRGQPKNVRADGATHTGRFLRLTPSAPATQSPTWRIPPAADRYWWIRGRGNATIQLETRRNEETLRAQTLVIQSPEWQWIRHALPPLQDFGPVQLQLTLRDGTFDADYGLLTMGSWPGLDPATQRWTLPAADFFRAGVSEVENHTVTFRPDHEVHGRVFFGVHLPLSAGKYEVRLHASSPAPEGTVLGEWQVKRLGAAESTRQAVRAGIPTLLHWEQTEDFLAEVAFSYNRAADITLEKVVFARIGQTEGDTR